MYKYRYRDNNRCIKHQLLFLSLMYQLHQVRRQLHKENHNLAQVITSIQQSTQEMRYTMKGVLQPPHRP